MSFSVCKVSEEWRATCGVVIILQMVHHPCSKSYPFSLTFLTQSGIGTLVGSNREFILPLGNYGDALYALETAKGSTVFGGVECNLTPASCSGL